MKTKFAYADNGGLPIAFAHRGGDAAGAKKENTMAAFLAAYRLGYRYFETDVICSADGLVVAIHGAKNTRDRAKTGLPPRALLQSKDYSQIVRDHKIDGEPIPLLSDLFAAFPDVRFNIDPKTKQVVTPLGRLIRKMGAVDRVGIGSFSYARTLGVAAELGGQKKVWTSLGPWGSVVLKTGFMSLLKHTEVAALQLPIKGMSRRMVERAHAAGLDIHLWTPNTTEQIITALDYGVDGIISDNLITLKQILLAKNLWPQK